MKKAVVFLAAALAMNLAAAVKLPAIFSDHAVLARGAKVPVFGKADPGEKVAATDVQMLRGGDEKTGGLAAAGVNEAGFSVKAAANGMRLNLHRGTSLCFFDSITPEKMPVKYETNVEHSFKNAENNRFLRKNLKNPRINIDFCSIRT